MRVSSDFQTLPGSGNAAAFPQVLLWNHELHWSAGLRPSALEQPVESRRIGDRRRRVVARGCVARLGGEGKPEPVSRDSVLQKNCDGATLSLCFCAACALVKKLAVMLWWTLH